MAKLTDITQGKIKYPILILITHRDLSYNAKKEGCTKVLKVKLSCN